MNRRSFIENLTRVASVAGAGLGHAALASMDMVAKAPVLPFDLDQTGDGRHVIILGAGLAGMTAAWELKKLNYKVTILEARNRSGGRVWTIRQGTTEREIGGKKQVCQFDDGQYFNAGAARIPHHHELTIHYCRQLGVALEVYNNINEGGYFYSDTDTGALANRRIRIRELHSDMRGYTTELLHKAISSDALDTNLTHEDLEKFLEYLSVEGALDMDKLYKGTSRRGYQQYPAAGNVPGKVDEPYSLLDLIQSGFLDPSFSNLPEYELNLQQTLFQPVGGMDAISNALQSQIDDTLMLGAKVQSLSNTESGVAVSYELNGELKSLAGDFCICTIPLPVLAGMETNLSQNVQRAIDFVQYNSTGKIGLQFKRRFWEEDDQIFGGISRTNMDITQIFYPNNNYLSSKGVLVGYYNFGEKAERMANLALAQRTESALQQGERIHPQYRDEFENSFSLAWHKIQFSQGGWAQYNEATRSRFYPHLIEPDKNIYFAGEHTTYLTAWMAGAFESARRTVDQIHARVNETERQYQTIKH